MQGVPDARRLPVAQAPPASAATAAPEREREQLPLDAGLEHVEDAAQGRAIRQPRMAALRLGRVRGEEGLDDGPEVVADQFMYLGLTQLNVTAEAGSLDVVVLRPTGPQDVEHQPPTA